MSRWKYSMVSVLIKWMCRYQASAALDEDLIIRIRCVGAGKHLWHAGLYGAVWIFCAVGLNMCVKHQSFSNLQLLCSNIYSSSFVSIHNSVDWRCTTWQSSWSADGGDGMFHTHTCQYNKNFHFDRKTIHLISTNTFLQNLSGIDIMWDWLA